MPIEHFELSLLDPDKLVKYNDLQEVSDPIYFVRNGVPTERGLLSNTIFGITTEERSNKFAYIDLTDWFIHPLIYKLWSRMDKKIREVVHGTQKFSINSAGELVEDENGSNGIKFLRDNIDKIKIKSTEAKSRDEKIKFIRNNKDLIFIRKCIVIPAYFRDVQTDAGYIGVGEINKLYDSLLIAKNALKETADYGLSMSNAAKGRVQEIILQIYNWFGEEPNLSTAKQSIIKRAVMSKTTDLASRVVLSAPNLRVENMEDMAATLDYSSVPLSSLCVNLFPYVKFWLRRFFENEFAGDNSYPYIEKGKLLYGKVKDPMIQFSDDFITKQIDRYIHGYSNRFIPVMVELENGKRISLSFKGSNVDPKEVESKEPGQTPLLSRKLTWCDLLFMACTEMSKDKTILITRYPMDSYFNQFPTMIKVASTKKTEPMWVGNNFYKNYPYIREEDIGKDTSNKFIDTLNICNLYLGAIGGDYEPLAIVVFLEYFSETKTA